MSEEPPHSQPHLTSELVGLTLQRADRSRGGIELASGLDHLCLNSSELEVSIGND
jgi:hypothetical protein